MDRIRTGSERVMHSCSHLAVRGTSFATRKSCMQQQVRKQFFPLCHAKNSFQYLSPEYRVSVLNKIKGESFELLTVDGVYLDAIWAQQSPADVTVLLIHPNAAVLDDVLQSAQWYYKHGFNVLAYTIRGYPGSGGTA